MAEMQVEILIQYLILKKNYDQSQVCSKNNVYLYSFSKFTLTNYIVNFKDVKIH